MKVLVTGTKGQLGSAVCARLCAMQIPYVGIDREEVDLGDSVAIRTCILGERPDAIIHCAAYTNVDKAEDEPALCHSINTLAVGEIARCAEEISAKLLLVSTDYVFSAEGDIPQETDSAYHPLSVYGTTKMLGELLAQRFCTKLFIVRTAWLFSENGHNFVRTMLRLGASREEVSVVADQFGSPTYAGDLANLLCQMVLTEKYGIYHATNEGFTNWAEFTKEIFQQAGLSCRVNEITTAQYPCKAQRPQNSRLSKRSLQLSGFALLPPWPDALSRCLQAIQK